MDKGIEGCPPPGHDFEFSGENSTSRLAENLVIRISCSRQTTSGVAQFPSRMSSGQQRAEDSQDLILGAELADSVATENRESLGKLSIDDGKLFAAAEESQFHRF